LELPGATFTLGPPVMLNPVPVAEALAIRLSLKAPTGALLAMAIAC